MAQNGKGQRGSGSGKSRAGGGSVKIIHKKDRETKAINENILALRAALFTSAGKDKNVLDGIAAPFMTYDRNGVKATIELKFKLNKEEQDFAFNLTKANMEDIYEESGYGWDDSEKKRELTENGLRVLLIRDVSEQAVVTAAVAEGGGAAPAAAKAAMPGKLLAFAHFRFTVQGEVMDQMAGNTTLYVMDVQVLPEYQRKGLGKHLITLCELIARRENMSSISVPIQSGEHSAKMWVEKSLRGYSPDVGLTLYGFDAEEEGFEVFAKAFPAAAPKPSATAVAAATAAAAVMAAKADSTKAASVPENVFVALKAEVEREAQSSEENKLSDSFQEAQENGDNEEEDEKEEEEEEEEDDEEGEEGEDDVDLSGVDVEQVVEQLSALFLKENGTAPTAEHIAQWRQAVTAGAAADSNSSGAPGASAI